MTLDAGSEQVREVFAYYGLAMYWAQCLEQSIFQHLLFFDHFPRAVTSYTSSEKWAEDFDRYEERELSQTMGKLICRLHESGQPTEDIKLALERLLKRRNWLAHGYFADRAVEFTESEGREEMLVELQQIQEEFRACTQKLDAITLPIAQKYGLTEKRLAQLQVELTRAYRKLPEA